MLTPSCFSLLTWLVECMGAVAAGTVKVTSLAAVEEVASEVGPEAPATATRQDLAQEVEVVLAMGDLVVVDPAVVVALAMVVLVQEVAVAQAIMVPQGVLHQVATPLVRTAGEMARAKDGTRARGKTGTRVRTGIIPTHHHPTRATGTTQAPTLTRVETPTGGRLHRPGCRMVWRLITMAGTKQRTNHPHPHHLVHHHRTLNKPHPASKTHRQ